MTRACLDRGHFLSQDDRHERLEDGSGPGQPQPGMAAVQIGDEPVPRLEPAGVVLLAAKRRGSCRRPFPTRAPGLDLYPVPRVRQVDGRGAVWRPGCAPRLVAIDPQRGAEPDRRKRGKQFQGSGGFKRGPDRLWHAEQTTAWAGPPRRTYFNDRRVD